MVAYISLVKLSNRFQKGNMPKIPQEDLYFIRKLYETILDSKNGIVGWDPQGKAFIVNDEKLFTSNTLAKEFGIGRFDSFARKLNKYGFRRSKVDKSRVRFFHKEFNKDGNLLHKIKKLSKEETLPKHIKLKLIRENRGFITEHFSEKQSDWVQRAERNLHSYQITYDSTDFERKTVIETSQQGDIGIYLSKDMFECKKIKECA